MVPFQIAVGHAGDVISHAPAGAKEVGPAAEPWRKFLGSLGIPIKQLRQSLLRRLSHLEHTLAAVNPQKEKPLQLPFPLGDTCVGSDDAGVGRARSGAGPFGGVDASLGQQRSRAGHQPRHLGVDQFVEHRPPEFAPGELAVAGPHALGGLGDQRELQQFLQRHQAQFHGVVGVVGVVGDRVGGIDHLRFQQRGRRPAVAAAGGLAIEHLARKIKLG